MRKTLYICIIIICFMLFKAGAQNVLEISKDTYVNIPNFAIGKDLPDFGVSKIINAEQKTIKTADFKDRLLILDFWATICSACIETMPHMQTLQQKYGNKIKILPVTPENGSIIVPFWKKNKHLKGLTIPSIVDGQNFYSYFQCSGIPHEIWVYKGKVIGITDHTYVDEFNIDQVLAGKIPNWPVKNDFYRFDEKKQSLFSADPNQLDTASTFLKYAMISDYKEKDGASAASAQKFNRGIIRDPVRHTIKTYFFNEPIFLAYTRSWMQVVNFNKLEKPKGGNFEQSVLWEVTDQNKYRYEHKLGTYEGYWDRKNAICFEALYKDVGQNDQEVYKAVIADMDRLLGLHVRFEKRKEKVWVLYRTGQQDKFSKWDGISEPKGEYVITLANKISNNLGNPYIFDETGYKDQGYMNIKITDWKDILAIGRAIAPYGLAFKEEERLVDRFIFTEVNGGLLIDLK